jgi:hypothetical protein
MLQPRVASLEKLGEALLVDGLRNVGWIEEGTKTHNEAKEVNGIRDLIVLEDGRELVWSDE